MISEIARFLSTLLAAALINAYIFWDVQNASRVCLAIGINIVVIIGYCICCETRVLPLNTAVVICLSHASVSGWLHMYTVLTSRM